MRYVEPVERPSCTPPNTSPSDALSRLGSMPVEQLERMEEIARAAACAWSERLGIVVTPDIIVLGALLAVPPEMRRAVEALAEHLDAEG